MKYRFKSYEYNIRVGAILLAAISPFICLLTYGYLPSISSYWATDLQPLFIITNAVTSYYLYSIKAWRYSALMLLLLTSFSIELYPLIHNFLAYIFFVINLKPIYKDRNYGWVFWLYVGSLIILPFSMTFAEIVAIESLCLYHVLLLNRAHRIARKNNE